jgi:hypothetical protein
MKRKGKKERSLAGCAIWIFAMLFTGSTALAEEKAATPPAENQTTAPAASEKPMAKTGADGFMAAGSKYISLSGGYVTTDYEDVNTDAEGWRINATFEMNPNGGKLLHGLTVGYMETSAERTSATQTVEYEVKSVPIYYAPKLVVGKKALKVFAKGALGFQLSEYSRSGAGVDSSANEGGFYGGGSLGAMLVLKEKIFVNAEYEWVYMTNAGYQSGAAQSAMFGVGMKF